MAEFIKVNPAGWRELGRLGQYNAYCHWVTRAKELQETNAAILQALEAITDHAEFWSHMGVNFDPTHIESALAAIRKAKGE